MTVSDRTAARSTSEATASAGLLLMFAAVIGLAVGLATLGVGSGGFATVVIVAAVTSFFASLACFFVDARRAEIAAELVEVSVPFPSTLRP